MAVVPIAPGVIDIWCGNENGSGGRTAGLNIISWPRVTKGSS